MGNLTSLDEQHPGLRGLGLSEASELASGFTTTMATVGKRGMAEAE
jgi:hypothetical protein